MRGTGAKTKKLSDEDLRADIASGLTRAEVVRKYSDVVTRQAVYKRLRALNVEAVAASVAVRETLPPPGRKPRIRTTRLRTPEQAEEETREASAAMVTYAGTQLNTLRELVEALGEVKLIRQACDEWLRDPEDPTKYNVGARSEEITVQYSVEGPKGGRVYKKERLSRIIARLEAEEPCVVESTETKHADPRELLLKAVARVEGIIGQALQVAKALSDHEANVAFRDAMLTEIAAVAPELREKIIERARRCAMLYTTIVDQEAYGG